ncbi:MAG TPA: ABC transporter ATP-binding protein [Elusimicrobiota bacterium]|nr:ABC transporter ATP-binding protein [Elusimicrobiota bacterium]
MDLVVSHAFKQFPSSAGPKKILKDISFRVTAGEVVCLLGPNGSGKTTLLKTIATLLSPDGGEVLLDGKSVHSDTLRTRRLLGFASSEEHSFYGRLTVWGNLRFYAQLHALSPARWKARYDELKNVLDLPAPETPFRQLSAGQKQKLLLARAVLHDPPVLILDEPSQHLDPAFLARFRTLATEEWGERRKKIVLISTHHLEDALKISDRWLVISEGRLRFDGSVSAVKRADPAFAVDSFFQKLTAPEEGGPRAD